MNLIILSEMSVYENLESICDKHGIKIKQVIAVDIVPIKYDVKKIKNFISKGVSIIFQSKNAIAHSIDIHEDINKYPDKEIYCIGKYSAKKINTMLGREAVFPLEDYSSESLFKLASDSLDKNNYVIIIKGEDGRKYLEKKLREMNCIVEVISVYERIPKNLGTLKDSIRDDMNNYFIVSSKTALNNMLTHIQLIEGSAKNIIIVPNIRIVDGLNTKKISQVLVVKNDASAEEYMRVIKKHNDE
ncbi:MAG: uroporphyrinogen-III synthase [Gammaproteobacteria bacterium]|jgi:uroporphyrinogen-III synthase|nr:uroporphyrinogen-III synthase [Gammaproteobacteria bacterium]MBT4655236.1 uroporphyrinogen-III synthase [Gammaproteobacteria bacterium]MBT5117019.1 uroporphyrinogen-III synthase [Gammaproteobacteria bacterium]MBT6331626.1 uroporphyrinogen-III synthase [Gammaproteobacteria bacterium]MBT7323125.1 uroporphyrinogen-III synthase [Gammaproteobacteria bacterium]